jgi:hypothetical protein
VLWSRMTPRVACIMNETVRRGFSSGDLFVIRFAKTDVFDTCRSYNPKLQIQPCPKKLAKKISSRRNV